MCGSAHTILNSNVCARRNKTWSISVSGVEEELAAGDIIRSISFYIVEVVSHAIFSSAAHGYLHLDFSAEIDVEEQ